MRFFACTGLFIEWNGCTTILTSASLVRDPDDIAEMAASVRIEVLLPNKQRREGFLQHCNLRYNVALVNVKDFRALRSANVLQRRDQHSRYPNVVAVGRGFESGILMATRGKLVPWSGNLGYNLEYSTCRITKAGIGGPVVDFDGKFIGMNFYDKEIGTPYLSWNTILEALAPFENKRTVINFDSDVYPIRWPVPKACWCHPEFVSELRGNRYKDDNEEYEYRYVNGEKLTYLISVEVYSPPV